MSEIDLQVKTYDLINRLSNVTETGENQWMALCPAHDDNKQSLSVGVGRDGRTLVMHCFANCETKDILNSLGLNFLSLFPDRRGKVQGPPDPELQIDKTYDYTDESGNLIYQVVRYKNPKSFRQRRPKPDGKKGWVWGVHESLRVPFNLPSVVNGSIGSPVFIVEGEKDVTALTALGQIATTNAGGAGKWLSSFSRFLGGRHVVIIPDHDEPGRKHAVDVAKKLSCVAASIKVVCLDEYDRRHPIGGDVSDWLANGGTCSRLLDIVREVKPWQDEDLLSPVFDEGRTDLASARRLIRGCAGEIRYCYPWKKWLTWNGIRWELDSSGEIVRRAKQVAEKTHIETQRNPLTDDAANAFALKLQNARQLQVCVSLAESEPGVPVQPVELDNCNWLLNCPNGTLDLKSGTLKEHRPEDLITKLCPTEFDPTAVSPTWARTLDSVFDGDRQIIDFIQRYFGYCLTGSVREQLMLVAWGSGSNGKTTLFNAFMETVGHDYCMTADKKTIVTSSAVSSTTELMDFHGSRFAICSETEAGERLQEAQVKSLTGDDPIRGRKLYQDTWQYNPTHKLVLCTNHEPEIQGTDHAIWRRIALLPFTQRFWSESKGESGPDHLMSDPDLKSKLQSERVGILNWCVQGCLAWQENGLKVPEKVRFATERFRTDQDAVSRFLEEKCSIAEGLNVRGSELFQSYRNWCEANSESQLTNVKFSKRLSDKGFDKFKSNGVWYRGICVLRNAESSTEQLEHLEQYSGNFSDKLYSDF